jgi:hypothetical protein
MLLNIHNEESLRIRNKKFSSEWPFKLSMLERKKVLCHAFTKIFNHTNSKLNLHLHVHRFQTVALVYCS